MRDFVDGSAFNFEQGQRARKLFAAVVLAALDDVDPRIAAAYRALSLRSAQRAGSRRELVELLEES